MDGERSLKSCSFEVVPGQNIQRLGEHEAAPGGWRHRVNLVLAEADFERGAPYGRVVAEIFVADDAARAADAIDESSGSLTAIKVVRARRRDAFQRGRKI